MIAARRGLLLVAKCLLSHSADPIACDYEALEPLDYCRRGDYKMKKLINQYASTHSSSFPDTYVWSCVLLVKAVGHSSQICHSWRSVAWRLRGQSFRRCSTSPGSCTCCRRSTSSLLSWRRLYSPTLASPAEWTASSIC